MKGYLDFNILVAIENKDYALNKIFEINDRLTEFPYSAAHIQETSNIIETDPNREKRVLKRLETIRNVSQGLYLFHDIKTREIKLIREDPQTVWEAIHQPSFGKQAINLFTNLFSHETRTRLCRELGIDSKEINNYAPNEVVSHLNKKIELWGTHSSLLDLIEKAISFFPAENNFGLHNRMAAMMEIIDMLGYWKDKATNSSNTARFWDANHCYYASSCDYLITDDKRNRYKARVLYEIYNINTTVISSDGRS